MRFIFILLLAVLLAACGDASKPAASPGADREATATAYYEAGLAHFAKGDLERAIADYDSAIELNPERVNAYINRGIAYYVKRDFDQAIADYDAAIDLNPNFHNPYYNRGLAYVKLGDLDRAIADYSKAIDLNPSYALAFADRGNAYYALGDINQAIADYDQAIALDPNSIVPPLPTKPRATPPPIPRGCPGGCSVYPSWCAPPIKGNVGFETGERIYHVLGQEYYEATVINTRYGERWFCTEEEAVGAGWRKARN